MNTALSRQINLELRKVYSEDDALAWISSPQPLLGLRIPARMIATGEGDAVLQALKSDRAR